MDGSNSAVGHPFDGENRGWQARVLYICEAYISRLLDFVLLKCIKLTNSLYGYDKQPGAGYNTWLGIIRTQV